MEKRKVPLKKRIKQIDLPRWYLSLGGLVVAIAVIFIAGIIAANQQSKAEEPATVTEPITAEEQAEGEALTYYDEIPLDAELQKHILMECDRLMIRPSIVFAIINQESNYQADAIGSNGKAYGLMQIQPKDHYDRMVQYKCTNLFNPIHNTTVGIDYLFELIQKENGIVWALMAFNGGKKYANEMTAASQISEYAQAVLNEAERLDAYVLQQ